MTHGEIVARVRRALAQYAPSLGAETLGPDEPLAQTGAFDSIALVQTALFLEREFGARVRPADLTGGAFRSLSSIARLAVARRTRAV